MKTRDLLGSLSIRLDQVIGKLTEQGEWHNPIYGKLTQLEAKLDAIQPASVDLTQEMADDIVRKIHGPLTIGQEFSDWIRQEAPHHDIFWATQIGYGSTAGQMHIILKTNGTLFLEMRDHVGRDLWRGTFVPPDFGGQHV